MAKKTAKIDVDSDLLDLAQAALNDWVQNIVKKHLK
jgi:hypothetical protein